MSTQSVTSADPITTPQFQRGSEWRRWDMQVHTPFSYLNNGFGSDWDTYVKTLFKKAIDNNVITVGITDYFTIDGYKKIHTDYLSNDAKLQSLFSTEEITAIRKILLLPNVEFRLNKLVGNSRINFHVIFSADVSIKNIEENFLHEIDFAYEGNPQNQTELRKLKVANLEELGAKLKSEHAKFAHLSDIYTGMMCAVVDDEQIGRILLTKPSIFEGKYVFALPSDEDLSKVSWNGQDHQARKLLVQKSDFIISHNANTINWGLGKFSPSLKDHLKEYKTIKPCLGGSDAHNFDELFTKNGDKKLWIKADATFAGLRQVLNEPDRSFIGELPPILKRINDNPTKYIDRLQVSKIPSARTADTWFDNFDIEMNGELTAIIGNKGKGKSALADILGLCGNSHNYQYFSFLNDKKFKKPQPINLANDFTAKITWKSGQVDSKGLNETPTDAYEKVKYLPQNFIEALCTNIDKKVFEDELEKVIYSRLDDADKIGKSNLKEIINYRKEIIESAINQRKSDLASLNADIVELERKNSQEYRRTINETITQKNAELAAHISKKPPQRMQPINDEAQKAKSDEINKSIVEKRSAYQHILDEQKNLLQEKATIVQDIADLQKLRQVFSQLSLSITQAVTNASALLSKFEIAEAEVIVFEIKLSKIDSILQEKQGRLITVEAQLTDSGEHGFAERLTEIQQQITALQNTLDTPNREYQEYLTALKQWQEHHDTINGDKLKEGTLEYYSAIKKYIEEELAAELSKKYALRTTYAVDILRKKHEIIDIYKQLYKPITDFIDKNKNEISEYNVNVDVKLNLQGFTEKYFAYISNGAAGSFIGSTEGRLMLNKLTRVIDFNNNESVVRWLDSIVDHLNFDRRDGFNPAPTRVLKNQLKGGYSEKDFYNFLFSLDYLEPSYELRLADKALSELSPGERGALLLIFYLLLDKDDIPIIIDQPEENLDNQSVYKILVPFIKKAKARRQIIIVTHNPNLAVVCDADQIIRTDIDKANRNKFTVKAGSLEDTNINAETIDVLEGTRPALQNRTSKYDIFALN
jgi:ABC-type lipoprotein export system ATPase subunit